MCVWGGGGVRSRPCPPDWQRSVFRGFSFSRWKELDSIQERGIIGLPKSPFEGEWARADFFYSHVWYDLMGASGREYVHAHYHRRHGDSGVPPYPMQVLFSEFVINWLSLLFLPSTHCLLSNTLAFLQQI